MPQIDIVTPASLIHPSPLLAKAKLFGLDVADTADSRVLEIDCGDGGNLLSIAASLPGAKCTGIAASGKAVEYGNDLAKQSGLKNVKLVEGDHGNIPKRAKYDVILIRSVYSRTKAEKRKKLLTLAAKHLDKKGILLVEHLCMPGWAFKESIRKQVQYHVRNIEDPFQKIVAGRQYLNALARSVPDPFGQYRAIALVENETANQIPDLNFALEYFEEDIEPSFFHEFISTLDKTGLQYVCEASLGSMMINRFPNAMGALLPEDAELTEVEQYLDFITNRSSRSTLLCADAATVERKIEPDTAKSLYFSMASFPVNQAMVLAEPETTLNGPAGGSVKIRTKASKSALIALSELSPRRLSFDEIVEEAAKKIGELSEEDTLSIAEALTACAVSEIVEIETTPGRYATAVPDHPVASALVRAQAAGEIPYVSSLLHRAVNVDATATTLLAMLDGTNDREALTNRFRKMLEEGELTANSPSGQALTDPEEISKAAGLYMEGFLSMVTLNGLLET